VPDLRNPHDPLGPFGEEASIAFFPTTFLSGKKKEKRGAISKQAFIKDLCKCWAGCKETDDGQLNKCGENFAQASTKQRWYTYSMSSTMGSF